MHVYLTKWRLKQGLQWPRHYPDPAPALANFARGCALAAVFIVVHGLVGRLEYQDAVAAETEARQTIERARIAVVRAQPRAGRALHPAACATTNCRCWAMIFECEARLRR